MDKIKSSNRVKILKELQKNGRASTSEIAEKTGLSRQTVAKTIVDMEKNKIIWGYSTIFNPKAIGKKEFMFLCKIDISIDSKDLLKRMVDSKRIEDNEQIFEFKNTLFLNGNKDFIVTLWANDVVEAKKRMNFFKNLFRKNIIDIELLEVIATLRNDSIANPNMTEELTKLLV